MSIAAADFLLAADSLVPVGSEVMDRSAVSRYYYCVHHEAQDFIRTKTGESDFGPRDDAATGRRMSGHEVVISLLGTIDPDAGDTLRELHARRIHADYHLARDWLSASRNEVHGLVVTLRTLFGTR